ncbi:hypothetical protein Sjap_006791 [Stephania japonica]|uniref:SANT domain-containing protein n=1 Tax=Stephania japonica TaxID=461633 RepID=A0AAP0PJ98_9MAGN
MQCVEENPSGNDITEETPDEIGSPSGIYGEPQVVPRVGDDYQVELPPLQTTSEYLQLPESNTDVDPSLVASADHFRLLGLPIPIMWICHKKNELSGDIEDDLKINGLVEPANTKGSRINLNNEDSMVNIKSSASSFDYERGLTICEPTIAGNEKEVDLFPCSSQSGSSNLDQKRGGADYYAVPGCLGSPWSDIERQGFLLGLYIFGKNLVLVKKFVESKEMGDILLFYYGKFYKSDEHRRWLECRKTRSRKCIHGQKIFTGWRQQELVSRLLPHVSKERQDVLLEVSRTFAEGKILLEEYVTTLKSNVGLNILVDAVGIGRRKHDLTGIVQEPAKVNHVIPTRVEIPVGKACSSLSPADIIKFLKGDFRLSKARSNDLFWEAVWPRLLARGWHSEQPKNLSHSGSKNTLVFLIPGVKKYSRRRLVKGNHYFDSVTDVLNKVASDPRLLEYEDDQAKGNKENEEQRSTEKKQVQDGQNHSYLRPKVPSSNYDAMKFTIVDTSLVPGEEPLTLRKLRGLPILTESVNGTSTTSSAGKLDGNNSEELAVELDSSDTTSSDRGGSSATSSSPKSVPERVECFEAAPDSVVCTKQQREINGPNTVKEQMEEARKDQCGVPSKQLGKTKKLNQFSRRTKSGQSNCLAPVTKRRRLTACSNEEANCSLNSLTNHGENKEENHLPSDLTVASRNVSAEAGPSNERVSTTSSAKENSVNVAEGKIENNCTELFDLNLPQVPIDFETDEPVVPKEEDRKDDQNEDALAFPLEVKLEQPEDSSRLNEVGREQQPEATRRHSTRSRPLTTKALEAFACGYLTTTKRKRRGMEPMTEENMKVKSSRRGRGTVCSAVNCDSTAAVKVEPDVEDAWGGDSVSRTNMVQNCHDPGEKLP